MVQTHLNVGVHFINLHVNIVFEKIIFYYFTFTIVHFIIEHLIDAPYATNDRAFYIYFDEATDGYTVENNWCPSSLRKIVLAVISSPVISSFFT